MSANISTNNFDLIRLLAASQVAIVHVTGYLSPGFSDSALATFLNLFPGVPIFFFISGFLISRAFEKNRVLWEYGQNRALRIFPALHVCVALNIVVVAMTGYFASVGASAPDVLLLYLAKTTFLQFYNPDFMRSFGDGVLNGSLWTICVELQFYFLVPVVYWLAVSENRARSNFYLIALMLVSMACNRLLYALESQYGHEVLWKLAKVSFIPWVYMFLCGVLIQRNFGFLARLISNRNAVVTIIAYIVLALVLTRRGVPLGNNVSPFLFFPLVAALMMAAYTIPSASNALLRGNDVSYGMYIYHQPVVNTFLYFSVKGPLVAVLTLLISLALAILSWIMIERPFLRRKRHSSHAVLVPGRTR